MVKIMVTDGGPHPADKWADITAEAILDLIKIEQDSVSAEAFAARQIKRELAPKLFAVFHAHHADVQNQHRADLKKAKVSKVSATIDVEPHLAAVNEVFALMDSTPFAAHFRQPHVDEVVRQIIGQHTADVIHIERKWHEDGLNAAKQGA